MGMYNEVFCTCPKCGGSGYMQIHQIVLGFGEFHLNDPNTLKELTISQLHELKEAIMDDKFWCENDDCRHGFNLYTKEEEEKEQVIEYLFGDNSLGKLK